MDNKIEKLIKRYQKAIERKLQWEPHWQECYEYAFPQRETSCLNNYQNYEGSKKNVHLFDATAPDAVDQLASSLLAELTPPWAKWFGLKAGAELSGEEANQVSETLNKTSEVMLQNFEHSNFAVEIHQCYLDLITAGTACLMFEEAPLGEASAFQFTAIPLREIAFEESYDGKIDTTFRCSKIKIPEIQVRFSEVVLPEKWQRLAKDTPDYQLSLIEAVIPKKDKFGSSGYEYTAFVWDENSGIEDNVILKEGTFATSPFINFRWLKAPGEIYGRSPVMKALPDIKTANKVVELILKNASISVTGIWQADDDGVLNPANIKLVPGAIIPKAVGSKGLTPLEAPGKFDVSQLILENLQARIKHALLADRLSQVNSPEMTATEVLARASEIARILGASFGRLQTELLTPLVKRAFSILRRRGDVLNFDLDGKIVDLQYKSPLAMLRAREDINNISEWLNLVSSFGPEALATVNVGEVAKVLGKILNVPENLMLSANNNLSQEELALSEGGENIVE